MSVRRREEVSLMDEKGKLCRGEVESVNETRVIDVSMIILM
jgi:hypothetical protein